MATTTNYGWTTPDDTALVKDGASAIRTLGSSVDTTTKNLNPETTLGDLSFRSSTSNVNTRLGIGSTGDVLTVAAGVPSWAAPAAGGMTLISTATLSGSSSISFTSIPATYKHLKIIYIDCFQSAGSVYWTMQFNQATDYCYTSFKNNTSNTVATVNQNSEAQIGTGLSNAPIQSTYTAANNGGINGVMDIYNYASTTLKRGFNYSFTGYDGAYFVGFANGHFMTTGTAISRLDWTRSSTQTITGTIQLWGVF